MSLEPLVASATLAWSWLLAVLPDILAAAAILIAGWALARWVGRLVTGPLSRSRHIDPILRSSISSTLRYGIIILAAIAALAQVGVQTASVLAALGIAGVAAGLAVQGTLANVPAGVMLLWLRPFRVGDYIETPTVAGSVRAFGLFATEIETFDGVYRFVPNAEIWNKPLLNHTRYPLRMLSVTVGLAPESDTGLAMTILTGVFAPGDGIRSTPAPEVFLDAIDEGLVLIACRAWVPASTFWAMQRTLMKRVQDALAASGISPRRLLHRGLDFGAVREASPGIPAGN